MPLISFVIPVYNRPQEIDELLESLSIQSFRNFEVVIVEDGSSHSSQEIVEHWSSVLTTRYIIQENAGPGPARNTGAKDASGDWLIFLDSDCLLPENYSTKVATVLKEASFDCFGGPDRAHEDFNATQKAIGHAMSSRLTTGGIRGGQEKMDKFYPRSYNLGVRNKVFQKLKGFSNMRFGEDLDFSMRLIESSYKTARLPEAWVWHKRRNTFRSFYKQVFNSGIARINLEARHPGTIKPVHLLPAVFTLGYLAAIVLSLIHPIFIIFVILPPLGFFLDSLIAIRQLQSALLAVPAAFTQLFGYGLGFIYAWFQRKVLKKGEFNAFRDEFYE
jgi:glycosyltransferase involved in cell wall biosynthesis